MSRDPSLFLSPVDEPAPGPVGQEDAPRRSPVEAPRPTRDRDRRRLGAVAVVLVLLAGAVVVNRTSASDGSADEGGAGAEPVAGARAGTAPPAQPSVTTTPPPALRTVEVRGPMLPEPTGTTVVLASPRGLLLADLDTGTVRVVAVDGMRVRSPSPYQRVLPLGDGLLTSGARPRLVDRSAGAAPREVQPAVLDGYLPSADERRWWVVDHRTSSGRDEALVLVERDLAGETGGRITLPSEGQPPLAVGSSFFLSTRGSVQRVDALTGDARRIGDGIAVAVDQRTLARVRCDGSDDCGLVLSDLDGGDERVITPPTPRSRYATLSGATFSPDGRWLVTPFFGEDQPGGLALVDVVQGERRFVDSLATSSRGGFPLDGAFTADSRWLLLAAPTADGRPVRAIRIEDSTIVDLDLAVPAVDEGESIELLAIPSIPADADPPG